jgi:hypothetical protein
MFNYVRASPSLAECVTSEWLTQLNFLMLMYTTIASKLEASPLPPHTQPQSSSPPDSA